MKKLLLFAAASSVLSGCSSTQSGSCAEGIKYNAAQDHIVSVIDGEESLSFHLQADSQPERITVELTNRSDQSTKVITADLSECGHPQNFTEEPNWYEQIIFKGFFATAQLAREQDNDSIEIPIDLEAEDTDSSCSEETVHGFSTQTCSKSFTSEEGDLKEFIFTEQISGYPIYFVDSLISFTEMTNGSISRSISFQLSE